MKKDDCLFCQIAAGEVPSTKVYEDEYVLAFEDINPMVSVHTLVIPKNHYDHIADGVPEEELGRVFAAVRKVAEIKGIVDSGFRTLANTNDHSCQTVHHLHVHVLGGEQLNDGNPSL